MKKRLFAGLLAVIMLVSMMATTASATDTVSGSYGTTLEDFAVEVSLDDLRNGVTVVLEDVGDGNYMARQLSAKEAFELENGRASVEVKASFHCGLNYNSNNNKGSLHWSATGYQLTRVQATIFCKDTSILFPEYFFNGDIDGYSDLSGRYNEAYGATGSFDISSDVKKVKVGWSSAYITTVTDGKVSMANASQTLTLADLPHSNVY